MSLVLWLGGGDADGGTGADEGAGRGGVHLTPDVPNGWLPPGLSRDLEAELAEWHALAGASDRAAVTREVLVARADELARRIAAQTGTDVQVLDGTTRRTHRPPEPTPWGTGLTLAAGVAVLTLVLFLALYDGLAALSPLLAVAVGVVLSGCLLPTARQYRTTPVWRWFVVGGATGIGVSWLWLLLEVLA